MHGGMVVVVVVAKAKGQKVGKALEVPKVTIIWGCSEGGV